jgi:hypothetical protein
MGPSVAGAEYRQVLGLSTTEPLTEEVRALTIDFAFDPSLPLI